MKRLTIGLLTLGFCSVGFANGAYVPPPQPINYFDGFYLGIGAGVNHTYANAKASSTENLWIRDQGATLYPISLDADLGDITGAGNAFVGWGKTFNSYGNGYFGIELFGRYTPTDMSAKRVGQIIMPSGTSELYFSTEVKLSNNYSFGGDLRLGYLITPKIMIYALAGLDIAEFEYKTNHTADLYGAVEDINYSNEVNSWQYGIMPGVGIEAALSDNVSVRAQYTYTYFGDGDKVNATKSAAAPVTSIASSSTGEADSVQRGLFSLAVTYHFKGV
jgi:opacity protein-like surface antigen